MLILRYLTIVLNIILAAVIMYFASKLHWRYSEDRPSIVGFALMIAAYVVDCLWLMFG